MATHQVLNQSTALADTNLFSLDRALPNALAREKADWCRDDLASDGARWGTADMLDLARLANENLPRLKTFDRFGNRLDQVEFHPAYHQSMSAMIEAGVHASPWTEQRPGAHVARAARFMMYSAVENGTQCPVTMTFAAIPIIAKNPKLAEDWMPALTSRRYDPRFLPIAQKTGATVGMGMTEKQGGSDVRANTTMARYLGEERWGAAYEIVGHKWFMSAPMCDAFLVLAQIEGEGLSCFFLPRILPDGSVNALHFQRLKDKLGNKSNASSEVEFHGAKGYRLGEAGRGIPTIIEMVNLTRLDCSLGSTGIMRMAVANAIHHARQRSVFGAKLIDQPAMTAVLADLVLECEAAVALCLRLARALDDRAADPSAEALLRIATPAAKYWICKRAMAVTGEAMEALGGNGYAEEAPLARFYREAPVNSIWEGSGNIMSIDTLRALRNGACQAALLAELQAQIGKNAAYDRFLARLAAWLGEGAQSERHARRTAESIALALQGAALLRDGATPVADAFCGTRLDLDRENWGMTFGTLPDWIDTAALAARMVPEAV